MSRRLLSTAAVIFLAVVSGCSRDEDRKEPGTVLSSGTVPDTTSSAETTKSNGILAEINRVRSNPSDYADELEKLPTSPTVTEAIAVLRATAALQTLRQDSRLNAAAQAHVNDIGPRGSISHSSSNGESFATRIRRFVSNAGHVGEAMSFGARSAQETVRLWIVDSGVSDRIHRKILLNPVYDHAGVACGPHKTYGTICVADFANL
jgi:uncharacterized protein YkwD